MRFDRNVVQNVRQCPYGGLKAACPQCIDAVVFEATMRAHSRYGEEPVIRLAWLIGIIERDYGLEHAARRLLAAKKKGTVQKAATIV